LTIVLSLLWVARGLWQTLVYKCDLEHFQTTKSKWGGERTAQAEIDRR
jgi:hypothetical protein